MVYTPVNNRSKVTNYTEATKSYLSLELDPHVSKSETAMTLGVSVADLDLILKNGWWEFYMTAMSESHSDAVDIKNLLSDTFSAKALGANPISVGISGVLKVESMYDQRILMLSLYDKIFRGSRLAARKKNSRDKLHLKATLHIKDTSMVFYPLSLTLSTTSDTQDTIAFSMSGVAKGYGINGNLT